jgi:hypothetical protein
MSVPTQQRRGTGWIVTSAILLILAGASLLINGLWALHANNTIQNSTKGTLLFSESNLDTWGWIYVIVGAVVLVAGFAVFWRTTWAVYVGLVAALVGAVMAFFWLFTPYWPDAMISIILNGVVIYGLGAYGLEQATS